MVRRMFVFLLGLAVLILFAACGQSADHSFGAYVPGQHIYDRAGVLTPSEITDLETHAIQAERSGTGAKVVVFLRIRSSGTDETIGDARALIDAWALESSAGARDGIAIFFNLTPNDTQHGQGALFAGQKHYNGGELPQSELTRIYNDVMQPDLANGQLANGIRVGLDAITQSLSKGPPPTPRYREVTSTFVEFPLTGIAILGALITLVFVIQVQHFRVSRQHIAMPVLQTEPPSDLSAALAGALVTRQVNDMILGATLIDLLHHGAITIEQTRWKQVRIHLVDHESIQTPYEEAIWQSLAKHANQEQIVSPTGITQARAGWGKARDALRADLVERGWFDANARQMRRPLIVMAIVDIIVTIVGFVLTIIAENAIGFIGTGILLIAFIIAVIGAASIPETTALGESEAAPWQAYKRGLRAARRDSSITLDLDVAVPYAVAFGTIGALDRRLKEASKTGYHPIWLGPQYNGTDFYPLWAAFYFSSLGGGSSSSGASSGGGGAGGGF